MLLLCIWLILCQALQITSIKVNDNQSNQSAYTDNKLSTLQHSYRLDDLIIWGHIGFRDKFSDAVPEGDSTHSESIGAAYANQTKSSNDYKTLETIIVSKTKHLTKNKNFKLPLENELVVHLNLRLGDGDVMEDLSLKYIRPMEYYQTVVKNISNKSKCNVTHVSIVGSCQNSSDITASIQFSNKVQKIFKDAGFNTSLRLSHGNPKNSDFDLVYMANAYYFSPSCGGLSYIVEKVVRLKGRRVIAPKITYAHCAHYENGNRIIISNAQNRSLSEEIMTIDKVSSNSSEMCFNKFSNRRFLTLYEAKDPPLLYSFPGSGNTFVRLLIEYCTGIFSGSLYNDDLLYKILPGEYQCSRKESVIKAHPFDYNHSLFHKASDLLNTGSTYLNSLKCLEGNVKRFKRAILLIRDPYTSMFSEFQRRALSGVHGERIHRHSLHLSKWNATFASLLNQYYTMWNIEYNVIQSTLAAQDVLFIRYEDLLDPNLRLSELQKIIKFLDFPLVTSERMSCAFELADKEGAHKHAHLGKNEVLITDLFDKVTIILFLLFSFVLIF